MFCAGRHTSCKLELHRDCHWNMDVGLFIFCIIVMRKFDQKQRIYMFHPFQYTLILINIKCVITVK